MTAPFLLALLLLFPAAVGAHEKGSVRLNTKQSAVGSEVHVTGERLTKNTGFRLELRGTLETHVVGEIRTGATGVFTAQFIVPNEIRVGAYSVVVVAPDGDVAARADLLIFGALPGQEPSPAVHDGMAGMHSTSAHATAEMMKLPIRTSRNEWIAIAVLSIAALAAGAFLLGRKQIPARVIPEGMTPTQAPPHQPMSEAAR